MTILVDELYGDWCHLWSSDDNRDALDQFALKLGLQVRWHQISHSVVFGEFYHYDLKPGKRKLALKLGAKEMALQDFIKQKWRDQGCDI